jgi:hypothetical protein
MAVRNLFHVMQIVDDFDPAVAFWDSLVAPATYAPKHWSDFDKRWASLASVGSDFIIEVMEPSKAPEDGDAPLPKFRSRFGQHLHSWSWFDDDLGALAERLRGMGIRVIQPYGDPPSTIFTHPKDTMGQLEFQRSAEPGSAAGGPSPETLASPYWRDEHPVHLRRLSRLTTVVADLDHARGVYEHGLGAPCFRTSEDDIANRAFVLVGDETVVELAQPRAEGTRLADDLARNGEIAHQVTFEVADLGSVADHVASIGVGVAERSADTLVLDPADCFGALLAFTTQRIPDDPRDR